MGIINHNVVIATTCFSYLFNKATDWLEEREIPYTRFESNINNYSTIFVGPDGSKEGWPESLSTDEARQEFVEFLEKNSGYWDWIEVGYGEYGQKVLRGNNQNKYSDEEYAV